MKGTVREHASFRSSYHWGYSLDDADRYGPALPQIMDLMRRIEDLLAPEPISRAAEGPPRC